MKMDTSEEIYNQPSNEDQAPHDHLAGHFPVVKRPEKYEVSEGFSTVVEEPLQRSSKFTAFGSFSSADLVSLAKWKKGTAITVTVIKNLFIRWLFRIDLQIVEP